MDDCAKLSGYAQAVIDSLIGEGITLTPAEVVELNGLCWAVEKPDARMRLARGVPVFLGAATLWPITLAGACFLEQFEDADEEFDIQATAYALAHGRDTGLAIDLRGDDAVDAVRRWTKGLRVTPAEMAEAVEQAIAQTAGPRIPPKDGAGDLTSFLVAACGGTPEQWERLVSLDYALAVLHAYVEQNKADGKPSVGDPKVRANIAVALKIEEIKRSRRG